MAEGVAVAGQQATGQPQGPNPARVPWSELGPEFIEAWGHGEDGKLRAEHWEVEGQSGSGKSYLVATAMQQRAQRWGTGHVAVITKNTDDSIPLLGWPVIGDYRDLREYNWALFWPQTTAKGEDKERFQEAKVYDLLSKLWPNPGQSQNIVLYFDEIRYLESLSRRLKKMVRMYWREGRSHGISIIAGAQRPLEMVRDMHSEARWKAVFCPADEADMERFAQLLGPHREWEPVLRGLDQKRHEFVLKNTFTKDVYISWVDQPLRALPSQAGKEQRGDRGNQPYGPQSKTAA